MKFLIVELGDETDVIMSTSLIANIKNFFRDSILDFFVLSENSKLLESHSSINNLMTAKKDILDKNCFLKLLPHIFKIRSSRYDFILTFSPTKQNAYIAMFSGAKTRVGINNHDYFITKFKPYSDSYEPIMPKQKVEIKLDALRVIGITISSNKTRLEVSDSASLNIHKLLKQYDLKKFVHLHLFSNNSTCIATHHFVSALVDHLEINKDIRVVLTTLKNKTEESMLFSAISNTKSSPTIFAGALDFEELIELSAKAELFIGIKGYTLHMALSQNTPSIALISNLDNEHLYEIDDKVPIVYLHENNNQHAQEKKLLSSDLIELLSRYV